MRLISRSLALTVACSCALLSAPGQGKSTGSDQQRQKDVPHQGSGEADPNMYQDQPQEKNAGASEPQDTAMQKQSNTRAKDKKKHNPQSHGPLRHNPDGQVQ